MFLELIIDIITDNITDKKIKPATTKRENIIEI
jgi:hypothetical protein